MPIKYPDFVTMVINSSSLGTILAASLLLSIVPLGSYAQSQDTFQTEIETEEYMVEIIATGNPIIFDAPGQAWPIIANGSEYTLNITFRNKGDSTTTIKNVDYNVIILSDNKELFNAQNQTSGPLHTATGNATIHYRFEELGLTLVRISILGVDSEPVGNNNSAEIYFQVNDSRTIPEFPMVQVIVIMSIAGVIAISVRGFRLIK